jgi:hypothetical protein
MTESIIEKRKFKRYAVHLKVFRQDDDKMLGYIEDINLTGMNLKSVESIRDKQGFTVYFGTDEKNPDDSKITMTVQKIWGAFSDTVPIMHSTGFYFVDPSKESLAAIQELISKLDEN